MHEQGQITKATRIIERPDGTQVRLVAQAYFGEGLPRSVGVDVFKRSEDDSHWVICSDQPHPDWRTMSVEEYDKRGRCEKFQMASHGEIFKIANLIGKWPHEINPDDAVIIH